MALADDPTDQFNRFLAAFPERDGGHDAEAARDAWERAIKRALPEEIIAGAIAYATAVEGRPARYIMAARRWLDEARWRDGAASKFGSTMPPLVWIEYGSPEWNGWAAFYRATKGKTPPQDKAGGWRFPSRFPPVLQAAE